MYQSSHSVGDAAAVPRPVSTRSIRPARPVSGVTQQNAMLGSPINSSPSSSSTTPLSLYPSHEPPVPSSEGVYQRDTAPSIVGQGVGTALATRATSTPQFSSTGMQYNSLPTNVDASIPNARIGALPPVTSPQRTLAPQPLDAPYNAHVPTLRGPQPLMPESTYRQAESPRPRTSLSPATSAPPPPKPTPPPPKTQENRPRGLKKLLAMMTCSSSSVETALDGHQGSTSPSKPSASPSQTRTSIPPVNEPIPTIQEELPRSSSRPYSGFRPRTSMTTEVAEPLADINNTHTLLRVPTSTNRHSLATSTSSSHSSDEEDMMQDVITQVSPNAPIAMGMSDPELEQEIFAVEQRLIQQGGTGVPLDEHGQPCPLLSQISNQDATRKCLVLDLDETLVHSSFKMVPNADFVVPVEIEGIMHNVYVIKRPGVDEFLRLMGQIYEVVIFTASLNKYADPVIDILDIHRVVRHRLFRESCYNHYGSYVKDLSQLGRPLHDTIILDNSPASYIFHPTNAVPVSSWFNDPHDTELTDLCPFLEDLCYVDDVRIVLDGFIDTA